MRFLTAFFFGIALAVATVSTCRAADADCDASCPSARKACMTSCGGANGSPLSCQNNCTVAYGKCIQKCTSSNKKRVERITGGYDARTGLVDPWDRNNLFGIAGICRTF